MTRLIDAEKLIGNITDMYNRGLMNDFLDIEEAIDETPTVESIPIKYIEKVRDNYSSNAYRNAVDNLLWMWRQDDESI